jgi:16S rRNA C967 or C1407 C5-methylase (RsmB/RsmF family)/NOL1/NOP2/fmu family ribosome biogenesis protein
MVRAAIVKVLTVGTKQSGDLPTAPLRAALGSIPFSDAQLQSLAEHMTRRWSSVLRHRRNVLPEQLPITTEPVPWYDLARRGDEASPIKPSRCLAYLAADYYLQDAGSLLALAAVGADTPSLSGLRVCDLCAAPGGKSTALVEAIGDSGFVLANEPIRSRIPALLFNLARTGSDRFAVSGLDPQQLADRVGGAFDVVVVDAPCSGQALMARGRQSASAMSEKQIVHSAARQNRILDAAVRLLREGGRLIYSTCTFAEAENEAQVRRLVGLGSVETLPVDRLDPYASMEPGCYRLWPHLDACAGSFAASLRGFAGDPETVRWQRRRPDKPPTDLTQWFDGLDDSTRLRTIDSVIVGWPSDMPEWVDDLAIAGPELAHRTGQTWKPSHAAALRRMDRGRCRQIVPVDVDSAKRFVAGETIPCPRVGWQVIGWQGRPLGWVKANGTIGKNHLPPAARIRGEILGE